MGPTEALAEASNHIHRFLLQGSTGESFVSLKSFQLNLSYLCAANKLVKGFSVFSQEDNDSDDDEGSAEELVEQVKIVDEHEETEVQAGLLEFCRLGEPSTSLDTGIIHKK